MKVVRNSHMLADILGQAQAVVVPNGYMPTVQSKPKDGVLYVGADLGAAYLILIVLDSELKPIAGEYKFAQVVRDGLVVDYFGAVELLRSMRERIEQRLGRQLTQAASAYPPGVLPREVRATANVVEAAGMECLGLVDEPTAANNLIGLEEGAIVDVGGGTTGIGVVKDGQVVYSADEPTGGVHFSLVIAGARNISLEEAEELKKQPEMQEALFPLVLPVMEKVANIIARHLNGQGVRDIILVGGAACFPNMAQVVQDYTGISTRIPDQPLFVTPIGIAMQHARILRKL